MVVHLRDPGKVHSCTCGPARSKRLETTTRWILNPPALSHCAVLVSRPPRLAYEYHKYPLTSTTSCLADAQKSRPIDIPKTLNCRLTLTSVAVLLCADNNSNNNQSCLRASRRAVQHRQTEPRSFPTHFTSVTPTAYRLSEGCKCRAKHYTCGDKDILSSRQTTIDAQRVPRDDSRSRPVSYPTLSVTTRLSSLEGTAQQYVRRKATSWSCIV